MPNNYGGMGVPRYVLPQYTQSHNGSRQGQNLNKVGRNNRNSTTVNNSSSSASPTTVAMHEESSSCRGSTSGESRDSDDVLMLHTPEGSVAGGDHMDPAEHQHQLELEQKKQQQRREEEDKEQQKQHADRLCPAPVVVVSKSPTSVAGLGWAGVLKMNLNAPPPAAPAAPAAPAVDKAVTAPAMKMPKPISRPTPASAPVAPVPLAAPAAVDMAPAPAPATAPATATATAPAIAPVAVPGKLSYAAMLGMAAKGPAADTVTASATVAAAK
jgi:hypothetical protein